MKTLDLPAPFLDECLAIPGQVAQLTDGLGWYEARPHQPVLQQLADPSRVFDIGLAPGDVTQVLGVEQPGLEFVLQQLGTLGGGS